MPGGVQDVDVTLLKAGVPTGPNKGTVSLWPIAGGSLVSYVWSGADLNGFAASDYNDPNFGVQLSASASGNFSAQVDYVQITITYTSGDSVHKMTMMGVGG